jgi:hypothetical protein
MGLHVVVVVSSKKLSRVQQQTPHDMRAALTV